MSRQIAVTLVALAVLIGATLAADSVVAALVEPTTEFSEDVEVNSGTWYCMPLTSEGQTAILSIAAVGDEASQVSVEQFAGGESGFAPTEQLEPNAIHEVEIEGAEQPPAAVVRWTGGPVVASWRVGGEQRLSAPCSQNPAPRWMVSGAQTTVGSSARLLLFNPFDGDAVVRVSFATPEGRVNLVSSENVSVPARQVVALSLNELQPEQPDLGVLVEVEAGRVVATGLQNFAPPDLPDIELDGVEPATDPNAPEGRTVLPATAVDATTVGLAYASSGETTTSWVTLLNPNTQPARITVGVSDAIAGAAINEEVVVGPESVARVNLDGLSSAPDFGVTLTSNNDVSIVANGFQAITGETKGVAAAEGIPEIDVTNAAPVAPEGSAPEIALFNPGDAPVTATISVGSQTPAEWTAIELAPGTMRLLPFEDAGVDAGGPVEASANEPIYATLRLSSDDDRAQGMVTMPLIPANAWQGSSQAMVPERDRMLSTRAVDFPAQQSP